MNINHSNQSSFLMQQTVNTLPTEHSDSINTTMTSMDPDSPQATTELSSLQLNREKNIKALERGLKSRRPVNELIGQGIIMAQPGVCNAEKVKKLERAKTTDMLKHKIEKRPERQQLVDQHILKAQSSQLSPLLAEKCELFEKDRLKETLSAKLANRPGSMELVERGVIPVDERVLELIQDGSISYPRVGNSGYMITEPPIYEEDNESHNYDPTIVQFHSSNFPKENVSFTNSAVSNNLCEKSEPVVTLPIVSTVATNIGNDDKLPPINSFPGSVCPAPNQYLPAPSISETESGSLNNSKSFVGKIVKTRRDHVNKMGAFVFHKYDPEQHARELQQEKFLKLQNKSLLQDQLLSELNDEIRQSRQQHNSLPMMKPVLDVPAPPPPPPPPKVKKRPNGVINMLECLTVTQLKQECRSRNLPCSGVKSTLLKHLEPYKAEILAQYNSPSMSRSSTTSSPQPIDSPKMNSFSPAQQNSFSEMKHSSSAPQIDYVNQKLHQTPSSTVIGQPQSTCETLIWEQPVQQPTQMYPPSSEAVIHHQIHSLDQKTKEIRQGIIDNLMKQKQSGLSEHSEFCQQLANERQLLCHELSQTRSALQQLANERLEDLKNQLISSVTTTSSNQQSPASSCRQSRSSSGLDPESEARLEEIGWLEELLKKSTSAEQQSIGFPTNGLFIGGEQSRLRSCTNDGTRLSHSSSFSNVTNMTCHSLPLTTETLVTQYTPLQQRVNFYDPQLNGAHPTTQQQNDVLSDISDIIQNDSSNSHYTPADNYDDIDEKFIEELCSDSVYNYDASYSNVSPPSVSCIGHGQLMSTTGPTTDSGATSFFASSSNGINSNASGHAYFNNQFGVASPMQIDYEVDLNQSNNCAPPPPAFIPSSQIDNKLLMNGLQTKSNDFYLGYSQAASGNKLSYADQNNLQLSSSSTDCNLFPELDNQNSMDTSDSNDIFCF